MNLERNHFSELAEINFCIGVDMYNIPFYYVIDGDKHMIVKDESGSIKDIVLEFPVEPRIEPDEEPQPGDMGFITEWTRWNDDFGDSWKYTMNVEMGFRLLWVLMSTGYTVEKNGNWYSYLINYCAVGDLPFAEFTEPCRLVAKPEIKFREDIRFAMLAASGNTAYEQCYGKTEIDPSDILRLTEIPEEDRITWFYVLFHRMSVDQRQIIWDEWAEYKKRNRAMFIQFVTSKHCSFAGMVNLIYNKLKKGAYNVPT